LREGFTAADDRLPQRMMTAFESGPIAGSAIANDDLERFKRRFYEVMAWESESGAPTEECLRELELDQLLAF